MLFQEIFIENPVWKNFAHIQNLTLNEMISTWKYNQNSIILRNPEKKQKKIALSGMTDYTHHIHRLVSTWFENVPPGLSVLSQEVSKFPKLEGTIWVIWQPE